MAKIMERLNYMASILSLADIEVKNLGELREQFFTFPESFIKKINPLLKKGVLKAITRKKSILLIIAYYSNDKMLSTTAFELLRKEIGFQPEKVDQGLLKILKKISRGHKDDKIKVCRLIDIEKKLEEKFLFNLFPDLRQLLLFLSETSLRGVIIVEFHMGLENVYINHLKDGHWDYWDEN